MPVPKYNYRGGPAADRWREQINKAKARGMTHSQAVSHCVRKYPQLQKAVLMEGNPGRKFEWNE